VKPLYLLPLCLLVGCGAPGACSRFTAGNFVQVQGREAVVLYTFENGRMMTIQFKGYTEKVRIACDWRTEAREIEK
jgi:hypothetical protein